MTIIRNSAVCLSCDDEIESKRVHDWVECRCGSIYVDGGTAYLRRGFADAALFKDTSIATEDDY